MHTWHAAGSSARPHAVSPRLQAQLWARKQAAAKPPADSQSPGGGGVASGAGGAPASEQDDSSSSGGNGGWQLVDKLPSRVAETLEDQPQLQDAGATPPSSTDQVPPRFTPPSCRTSLTSQLTLLHCVIGA